MNDIKKILEVNSSFREVNMFLDYKLRNKSITWISCNNDIDKAEVEKILSKFKSIRLTPITKFNYITPEYVTDYVTHDIKDSIDKDVYIAFLLDTKVEPQSLQPALAARLYIHMKANGDVYTGRAPKRGLEVGEPWIPFRHKDYGLSFGLYEHLSIPDREIFEEIVTFGGQDTARMFIDVWFGHMSRAGLEAKYHQPRRLMANNINRVASKVFKGKCPPTNKVQVTISQDEFHDMLEYNEIGANPDLIYTFLTSDMCIEDFTAKYSLIDLSTFTQELMFALDEVYRLMRNSGQNLVLDRDYKNIQNYPKLGVPFYSHYASSHVGYKLI